MNIDAMDLSKLPSPTHRPGVFIAVLIPDKIGALLRLYEAVGEWRAKGDQRLAEFGRDMESKRKPAWSDYDYDPTREEAFMLLAVEQAMFGSLAVAITSTVEDSLAEVCSAMRVQLSARPTWGEKKNAIERKQGVQFRSILGFSEVTRARLVGNCFKHNGGKVNDAFAEAYRVPMESVVETEKDDWHSIIRYAEAFLTDLAARA